MGSGARTLRERVAARDPDGALPAIASQGVLGNGLRVKLRRQTHQRTINLGLFFCHGAEYETRDNSGISHYIEHVLLNPKHMEGPTRARFDELVDAGTRYEAFTSKEYTRFMITCFPDQVEKALGLASAIVQRAEVDAEAVEHERPIILHEHAMTFSSTRSVFGEMLDHAIWGEQSLGLFVIGRKENIERFGRAELAERIRRYYVPERSFLVAFGPLEPGSFLDLAEDSFAAWRRARVLPAEPFVREDPQAVALPSATRRVDLLLGFPGVPFASPERPALELLADLLGGNLKSRLFLELRESRKLAYVVQAYPVTYARGGYLGIRINCKLADVAPAYEVLARQLEAVRCHGVTREELERARAARIMEAVDVLGDSGRHLQLVGRRAVLGEDFSVDREVEGLAAVDSEEVAALARRILVPERAAVVGLGLDERQLGALLGLTAGGEP